MNDRIFLCTVTGQGKTDRQQGDPGSTEKIHLFRSSLRSRVEEADCGQLFNIPPAVSRERAMIEAEGSTEIEVGKTEPSAT